MFTLLASIPFSAGCNTVEAHDRAANAAEHVVAIGVAGGKTREHLDATVNALEQVLRTKDRGPKAAFDTFAKELGGFQGSFADFNGSRGELKPMTEAWFTDFEKQNETIHDGGLRADGAKRLDVFRGKVKDYSRELEELTADTTAVETRLGDLRTYLGNDLTPRGIDSVSGRIEDAVRDGRKLGERFGALPKSSNSLATSVSATQPAPAN